MHLQAHNEILDIYWRFAAARQDIFFARLEGKPAPWTDDPILAVHKFCNAYRASDRVSQFLLGKVIYAGPQAEEDHVFRIILFKIFNQMATWAWLEEKLRHVTLAGFDVSVFDRLLTEANLHFPIYTNAYMSCATKAFGFDRKHRNHLALLHRMFVEDKLAAKVLRAKSFEALFNLLRGYPLMGDFMAYQLATDLNYSPVVNFRETDFVAPGPGALRGIAKCFPTARPKDAVGIIRAMQEMQEEAFAARGLRFRDLFGRPLQLIDCQGLFCETDKYTRASHPDLKSARSHIKQKFKAHTAPLPLCYPPKWRLKLPESSVILPPA